MEVQIMEKILSLVSNSTNSLAIHMSYVYFKVSRIAPSNANTTSQESSTRINMEDLPLKSVDIL
jgi:hypothetical protein